VDFLIYKSLRSGNEDYTKLKIDLCEDQQVHCGLNYVAAWRPSTTRVLKDTSALLLSGHVQYKTDDRAHSAKILAESLTNGEWPLSEEYTGVFSGVLFSDNTFRIFNDPIGLFHLYYCITAQYVIVATNLNAIFSITGSVIKGSALSLEMTRPEFSQYGRSTVLENVYTLMPGEMLVFKDGKTARFFDTTIKTEDKLGYKNLAYDLVDLINSEFKNFYQEHDSLMVSMSGGIDSRINLAGLLANDMKPLLSNFGRPEYVDSKIPRKIAEDIGLKIDIIDPVRYQFPPKPIIDRIVKETDALYVNQWLAIFDYYREKQSAYPLFLLGDMCDILRAKGIGSLKTRTFRRNHYVRKFLTGKQLSLVPLSEKNKRQFVLSNRDLVLSRVKESVKTYLEGSNQDLIDEVEADLIELFEHLNRYNPSYLESYEELFGIFTHGRRSMGKQLNVLKVRFTPEIPILNLRIIRQVLNYSPLARYGDELTNGMFRHNAWQRLGSYPTAQNPFMPYNSKIWLMLLGWFLRSSTDQAFLKMYVLTKGKFSRQRLVKSRDILSDYLFPGAQENYSGYFLGSEINATNLIHIFDARASKRSWPLSGQDLIPYAQAAWYSKHFHS
jgi:hypothetical protein